MEGLTNRSMKNPPIKDPMLYSVASGYFRCQLLLKYLCERFDLFANPSNSVRNLINRFDDC